MKIKITAAVLLITGAILALPQAAFAGKPEGRTPKDKVCPFMDLSACNVQLATSINLVQGFAGNGAFTSRNPEKDAGSLVCKLTGADIKLFEGKIAASDLLADAIAKILVLRDAYKLDPGAWQTLNVSFVISKACIDAELGL